MDRAHVFDQIRQHPFGGKMSQSQVDGTTAILDAWEKHAPASDPRFIAATMGTAYHETAATMQPIAEIGKGRTRPYGQPAGPYKQTYYGRGLVQLTWERNYAHATTRLRAHGVIGIDTDLDKTPDLAMRSDIAAAVMVFGCLEGWFTGKKLGDFFVGTRSDWIDARTIINGHDCAAKIAAYSLYFYHALTA